MGFLIPFTVGGVCTFWAMPNLLVLTGVIYLCGLTIAPTLIAGYSLLESTARPVRNRQRTLPVAASIAYTSWSSLPT